MPYFNFATYADYREEWAIEADSLEEARRKIGTDPDGDWLNDAFHLDGDCVERRDEFFTEDDDTTPVVEEITSGHWAWRNAHRDWIERSIRQNIAAIAVELHTHRLFDAFYSDFGQQLNGFVGIYDFCIAMAEALTDWEIGDGLAMAYENHGVTWIEVVEDFVDDVITNACWTHAIPDLALTIDRLQVLQPSGSGKGRRSMITVRDAWKMACPRCGDDQRIDICASIWVRLCRDGTDVTAAANGDHEWGHQHQARCCTCGYQETVARFQPKEDAP